MSTTNPPNDVAWYHRYRALKFKFAMAVSALALIFAGLMWVKKTVLVIDPGKGKPLGLSVRSDRHIATLIQSLEAYTPSLHRDGSKDRFTISIFIVPLDGAEPKLIPIVHERSFSSFQLAKVLGSDGRTLWFDVNGVGGVDLETYELVPTDQRPVDATSLQGAQRSPITPRPDAFLAAGLITSPGSWLGLHSPDELAREFAPKKFVRRIERQQDAKQLRRFHRGVLDAPVEDKYHRIISMTPVGEEEYLNAAFLRMDDSSEPIRPDQLDGALMLYTSRPGLGATLMVSRVSLQGDVLWKVDTGIDRFSLQQILPEEGSTAFVGTRPRVEGKVPEPLLVVVEHGKGTLRTLSLWQ
jgi:hypothetical protein